MNGIKEISKGTETIHRVDPAVLTVDHNFREDYGSKDDWNAFKDSIRENGVKEPLVCYRKGEEILINNGHRRHQAAMELIEEGMKDLLVPIRFEPKGTDEIQRAVDFIVRNDGKPPTPYEEAKAIAKLHHVLGQTPDQISRRIGRTMSHVSNALLLSTAPAKVAKLIQRGKIASTEVTNVLRECKGDADKATAKIEKAVERAEQSGKKKATGKHIEREAKTPTEGKRGPRRPPKNPEVNGSEPPAQSPTRLDRDSLIEAIELAIRALAEDIADTKETVEQLQKRATAKLVELLEGIRG